MKLAVSIVADPSERERVERWARELAATGLVEFLDPWWDETPREAPEPSANEQDIVWVLWPLDHTCLEVFIQLGAVLMVHATTGHPYPVLLVSGEGALLGASRIERNVGMSLSAADIVSREDVVAFERIASRCRHLQSIAEVS